MSKLQLTKSIKILEDIEAKKDERYETARQWRISIYLILENHEGVEDNLSEMIYNDVTKLDNE